MEEGNADSMLEENNEGDDATESAESVVFRELSFSGWCHEDGVAATDPPPENSESEAAVAREGFVLPPSINYEQENHSINASWPANWHLSSIFAFARGTNYHPLDVEQGESSRKSDSSSGENPHGVLSAKVVLKTLFFILLWYTFSTCLTLYNKTLLGNKLGKFPAPLLMNTVHFALQAVFSRLIIWFRSRNIDSKTIMSWKDYFFKVVPTALGTALDINLSNASLVFISVTFATMCKSASPIFLLIFAFAFKLESPSIKLVGIILIISFGVLLAVARETEFEFWGFIFIIFASVMSGFRWSMTQILLQKETYGLKDPLTLMSHVTPVMSVVTGCLSLILDHWDEFKSSHYFDSSRHIVQSCLLMLLGGALAFFMVLTEYILVSATSAVTVTIAGVVKEAVTIVVAVLYFHDNFTWLKGLGLVTIMVGVSLFNLYKYQKLKKESPSRNVNEASKYVILDEMDFDDDSSPVH